MPQSEVEQQKSGFELEHQRRMMALELREQELQVGGGGAPSTKPPEQYSGFGCRWADKGTSATFCLSAGADIDLVRMWGAGSRAVP